MIAEVDGSIANPAVAWGIALWSLLLVGIAVVAARRYRGNRRSRATAAAALLALSTPVSVKVIATLFYLVPARSVFAVHFWGFSALQWIAPGLALVAFALTVRWPGRQMAAV